MHEQRSQRWKKNVTTRVHLFGVTNKATWPKSLMSGAKIKTAKTVMSVFEFAVYLSW